MRRPSPTAFGDGSRWRGGSAGATALALSGARCDEDRADRPRRRSSPQWPHDAGRRCRRRHRPAAVRRGGRGRRRRGSSDRRRRRPVGGGRRRDSDRRALVGHSATVYGRGAQTPVRDAGGRERRWCVDAPSVQATWPQRGDTGADRVQTSWCQWSGPGIAGARPVRAHRGPSQTQPPVTRPRLALVGSPFVRRTILRRPGRKERHALGRQRRPVDVSRLPQDQAHGRPRGHRRSSSRAPPPPPPPPPQRPTTS